MVPTQRIEGKRVIQSGLAAGERVLIDHLQQARPGMQVVAQDDRPGGDGRGRTGALAAQARARPRRGGSGSRARAGPSTTTKNTGTIASERKVAAIIPPKTAVPSE